VFKDLKTMRFGLDLIKVPCRVRTRSQALAFSVWSHKNRMSGYIARRDVMRGSCAWAVMLGFGANVIGTQSTQAGIFGGKSNAFDTLVASSRGAVAATFSDFAVQSPEGNTCTARLAYPLVLDRKLPVIVFCPEDGATASQYDQITGALAAQNFFVLTIDRRANGIQAARAFLTAAQQEEQRLRRFAEVRFLLDTIDAAAAALGPKAEMVDTTRVGTIGHGNGAWIAAGLGGWDSNGAASTRTRDGRVYAVVGLLPSIANSAAAVPAQRSPDGVSGMFIGNLAQLPVPARGSGLLGLGLAVSTTSFGGLIGPVSQTRSLTAEPQALGAAIASAVLFFNWTLRGNGDHKKELMALDGRRVEGLSTPLQLRKA
jgi:hypothetical protein